LDVTLPLAFEEGVAVEREDPTRGLVQAGLRAVVASRAIEGLPANGRDFIAFTLLTPGVSAERVPPTGPTVSSGLSFAGQRARSNHFLVDGFDNDEVFTGAVGAALSQDAVREFRCCRCRVPRVRSCLENRERDHEERRDRFAAALLPA
jgi:hypothetical protein